jgi:ammonia channel protein AmtB
VFCSDHGNTREKAEGDPKDLADSVGKTRWLEQVRVIGVTIASAILAAVVLASVIKATIRWRPDAEREEEGLDAAADPGEAGYLFEETRGA